MTEENNQDELVPLGADDFKKLVDGVQETIEGLKAEIQEKQIDINQLNEILSEKEKTINTLQTRISGNSNRKLLLEIAEMSWWKRRGLRKIIKQKIKDWES